MSFLIRKSIKLLKLNNVPENVSNFTKQIRPGSVLSTKLVYSEYGEPNKVIKVCEETINEDKLKPDDVLIKMLASPVNPADINTIQGKYPVKPTLPAVGGNEGVAEVINVGREVSNLTAGDHVIPLVSNFGTWRTYAILSENLTFKVPKSLGIVEAATLSVNPCTAYRMIKDFVDLLPGDSIIQNGGNSTCGQYIIQICKAWGFPTINIIRDRPDIYELKRFLTTLGATHVLTEEELRKTDIFKSNQLQKPRLALNCVGGKSALELLRYLQPGGCLVTYGGMSRQPVTIPTSALIFKNIVAKGFWMTQWNKEHFTSRERFKMIEDIIALMTEGQIQGPAYEMVDYSDYITAISNTLNEEGKIGRKYILNFTKI